MEARAMEDLGLSARTPRNSVAAAGGGKIVARPAAATLGMIPACAPSRRRLGDGLEGLEPRSSPKDPAGLPARHLVERTLVSILTRLAELRVTEAGQHPFLADSRYDPSYLASAEDG
ncbi:hypothetical protein CPLU01_12376 [Colletotrichum plurivorum]|uniref:Uncharacterized protein n=1 Tax=Colletotrichum plurivorum TaxID=2175906 RepID=A0A8H6JZE6_9PEZI|nr:hypothetical protein CPLU01_12376 [Colletotrichum plurivorum]